MGRRPGGTAGPTLQARGVTELRALSCVASCCRVLWSALAQCLELGSPGSAALDVARARFIERELLPALNRQGDHGW